MIGQNAFGSCKQIQKIAFQNDSKLQTIDTDAFCYSLISSIAIPENVTNISHLAFFMCDDIQIIEINIPNSQSIDESCF